MGVSSDADLDFGIDFGEDASIFPWNVEDEDGDSIYDDVQDWWLNVTEFNIEYPSEGYFESRNQHLKQNPLPFDVHTHCHYDYPMYILKVPGYGWGASRGYPTEVDPSKMVVSPADIERFKQACEKYGIPYSEPRWILSSAMG